MKKTLIVDGKNGPYKTIQEAIDDAESNCVIKVGVGLYSENLVVNKGGLRLEPKEKEGDIIIVVSSRPTVTL